MKFFALMSTLFFVNNLWSFNGGAQFSYCSKEKEIVAKLGEKGIDASVNCLDSAIVKRPLLFGNSQYEGLYYDSELQEIFVLQAELNRRHKIKEMKFHRLGLWQLEIPQECGWEGVTMRVLAPGKYLIFFRNYGSLVFNHAGEVLQLAAPELGYSLECQESGHQFNPTTARDLIQIRRNSLVYPYQTYPQECEIILLDEEDLIFYQTALQAIKEDDDIPAKEKEKAIARYEEIISSREIERCVHSDEVKTKRFKVKF